MLLPEVQFLISYPSLRVEFAERKRKIVRNLPPRAVSPRRMKAKNLQIESDLGSVGRKHALPAKLALMPELGLALATLLFKNRFTADEREAGKAAWVLGLAFITEGAIPFAAEAPFRVIPSIMIGSGITGALSMLFQCQLRVPHGGVFVLLIPNVVTNLPLYALSIVIGTVVTAGALFVLKRPIAAAEGEGEGEKEVVVVAAA